MANWWDDAPVVQPTSAQTSSNWWEAAPLVEQQQRPDVQSRYDALPWYEKAGQAADDVVRLVANGATFGYADKLASAMNGTPLSDERQKSADASTRAGSAGLAAELEGGLMTGSTLSDAGVTAARFVPAAMPGILGLGARVAATGADGAAYGALGGDGL